MIYGSYNSDDEREHFPTLTKKIVVFTMVGRTARPDMAHVRSLPLRSTLLRKGISDTVCVWCARKRYRVPRLRNACRASDCTGRRLSVEG